MVRAWKLFWIALWSILIATVFTRNVIKYKKKKLAWNLWKSVLDTAIIVLSAIFLPPFLIAMDCAWVISHFTNKWVKLGVGLACGIIFGLIGSYAMEIIILFGIFSVDAKTGPDNGIIKRWADVKHEEMTGEPVAA